MNRHDYFVLGNFGYESNQLDGQTIKTRSVYELIKNRSKAEVLYYDTDKMKKNKLGFLLAIYNMCRSKRIIYLPAHNNLKYFFSTLYRLSKIFNFEIHYFVVGGWLSKFLTEHKSIVANLGKIKMIYLETNQMQHDLKQMYGIANTTIFPNFRQVDNSNFIVAENESLKLVFMSRIMKKKGIEMIIDFVKTTAVMLEIDFYGQIAPADEVYFTNQLKQVDKLNYKGVLSPNEISKVLSKYDLLLLPTKFYTEGLPGAIVDAYFAGIPVLVTKWLHAEEFVRHEETGFIIPFENGENDFNKNIEKLHKDREQLHLMKKQAKKESLKFTPEMAWSIFKKNL